MTQVDIDNILDEAGRYLKRNPDVLVVCLGAATVAAGAVVFMHKQRNGDSENGNGRARTSPA